MMKRYVIIVAGGKGLRMGADLPKQFIPLAGKPVLMRTLENFSTCGMPADIVLVLPRDHQEYWRRLCREYGFRVPHRIADGGETRFHSVRNGLLLVDDDDAVVAVHDGVRPFVKHDVIRRTGSGACYGGGGLGAQDGARRKECRCAARRIQAGADSAGVSGTHAEGGVCLRLQRELHRRCLCGGSYGHRCGAGGRKQGEYKNHHAF